MEFNFKVRRGDGVVIGNILRQFLINYSPHWKIIGFSLDKSFTSLNAGAVIAEDIVRIITTLSQIQLTPKKELGGDFLYEDFFFDSFLDESNLVSESFDFIGIKNSIVTVLDQSKTNLRLFYRKAQGACGNEDNLEFLKSNNVYDKNINVMSSHHFTEGVVYFNVSKHTLEREILKFTVESKNSDGKQLLLDSISDLRGVLVDLESTILGE